MLFQNQIRVAGKEFKNSYWVKPKDGFQMVTNGVGWVAFYCEVLNGEIIGGVEVIEYIVTRREKINVRVGNYLRVLKHFEISE